MKVISRNSDEQIRSPKANRSGYTHHDNSGGTVIYRSDRIFLPHQPRSKRKCL